MRVKYWAALLVCGHRPLFTVKPNQGDVIFCRRCQDYQCCPDAIPWTEVLDIKPPVLDDSRINNTAPGSHSEDVHSV